MEFQVEHNCPQCGGTVTLDENARLLTCPYCSTKNFLLTNGYFRYVLPDRLPENADRGNLCYAPYLRLKGTLFEVSDSGIDYKVIDATQAGMVMEGLPPTLGARPQAMIPRRVGPDIPGAFFRLMVQPTAILEKAAQAADRAARREERIIHHRAYIGETLSFIYLPLYLSEQGVMDGVLGEPLGNQSFDPELLNKAVRYNPRWQYRFLATICPHCGGALEGEPDCLVALCPGCNSAWEPSSDELTQVRFEIMHPHGNPEAFLPFWRLSLRIPSFQVKCYGDFVRLIRLPLIPKKEWDRMVMAFWIPAFKIQPKVFHRISKRMTLAQHRLERSKGRVRPGMYPVTLPATEAWQAVKIVLAGCLERRKDLLPRLADLETEAIRTTLVYLPFNGDRHDLIQPDTTIAVNRAALGHGRKL